MQNHFSGAAGLGNAIGNAIYGTKELKSVGDAFARGFGAGAAESAIDYLADTLLPGGANTSAQRTYEVSTISYDVHYNPKNGCGGTDSFSESIGSVETRGYTQTPIEIKNG